MIKSIISGLIISGLISVVALFGMAYLLQYLSDIGLNIPHTKENVLIVLSVGFLIFVIFFYVIFSSDYTRYKAKKLINELENAEKEEALKKLLKKNKDITEKYDIKV